MAEIWGSRIEAGKGRWRGVKSEAGEGDYDCEEKGRERQMQEKGVMSRGGKAKKGRGRTS